MIQWVKHAPLNYTWSDYPFFPSCELYNPLNLEYNKQDIPIKIYDAQALGLCQNLLSLGI